jgi:hypothetical protein
MTSNLRNTSLFSCLFLKEEEKTELYYEYCKLPARCPGHKDQRASVSIVCPSLKKPFNDNATCL